MYDKRILYDPAAKADYDKVQMELARERLKKVSDKKHKIRKEKSSAS